MPCRTRILAFMLSGFLIWSVTEQSCTQAQWTRFRGPDGSGIINEPSIPVKFTAKNFHWQIKLPGPGNSSPVVWGNKIFLTCKVVDEDARLVICLDADTGRILWSFEDSFEPYKAHKFNSVAGSTPAVDAKHVYISWVSGSTFIVLALDHDGNEVWQRRMEKFESRFGPGASPIVLDDIVIMSNDHPGESCFLIALDTKTGETRWKLPRNAGFTSFVTPAVYRPVGGPSEVIFVSPAHGITSIDPREGKVNWELSGLFTLKTVASPVIADGVIFASSGRGNGDREFAAVRPGNAKTGIEPEQMYQIDAGLPYVPTPIAMGEYLFFWSDSGIVSCIEARTGKLVWRERVSSSCYASPIRINGRIYNVTQDGQVVVIEAQPQYKLLARNQLPEGSNATPAVANGCIYFRTYEHLICVGKEQP